MRGLLLFVGWVNIATWVALVVVHMLWRAPRALETATNVLTLGVVLLIAANTKGLGLPK